MLEEEHKRLLLRLAREAISDALAKRGPAQPKDIPGVLQQQGASFITIMKAGQVRGRVGTLSPHLPLYRDVIENARRAAFDDCDFEQIRKEELGEITIEISVLSPPAQRHVRSTYDLLDLLRAERPGVILRHGYHQATLLPQYWEQIPGAEEFLGQLCMKAGLASRAWEDKELGKKLTYATYTVETMRE